MTEKIYSFDEVAVSAGAKITAVDSKPQVVFPNIPEPLIGALLLDYEQVQALLGGMSKRKITDDIAGENGLPVVRFNDRMHRVKATDLIAYVQGLPAS